MADIDTTPGDGNISTSSQGTDTASSAPASADTASSNQPAGGSASDTPAQADTQSSTDTLTSGAKDSTKTPSEATVPESRYKSLQAEFTRTSQARAEFERKLQEMEKRLEQQSQSQEPIYSPRHPRNADFRKAYDAYAYTRNQLSQQYDATRTEQALKGIFGDRFGSFREYENHLEERKREAFSDPDAWFEKQFQDRFNKTIPQWQQNVAQQYQTVSTAQQEVQQWMSSNKEIATPENCQKVAAMMEKGATFNEASAKIERDFYRSKIDGANQANVSADEKQRLLEQNAAHTITRTPASNHKVDVKKVWKERGIDPNNQDQKIRALMELDEAGKL